MRDILHNAYARRVKGAAQLDVGAHDRIDGLDGVADLLLVDQSPLGRSARSNPVTYTKAWDEIRQTLRAARRAAVSRGITARDFSFNSAGRPLRGLQGTGWQTIDMQFLADVTVRCDVCDGRRFQSRVLAVRLPRQEHRRRPRDDGRRTRPSSSPARRRSCAGSQPLLEAGLGYMRLGQPTATLSGGEAQRLKLAAFLGIRPASTAGRPLPLRRADDRPARPRRRAAARRRCAG